MYQGSVLRRILGTTKVIIPGYRVLSFERYASKRISSSDGFPKTKENKDIGHTTVILQDRLDIQEVPTIVRKVPNSDIIQDSEKTASNIEETHGKRDPKEDQEITERLNKCQTILSLRSLLDILSNLELSPPVALHALKKLLELENNAVFRNQIRRIDGKKEDFKRTLTLNHLLYFIRRSPGSDFLLEGLRILSRDTVGQSDASYKERVFNEILIRSNEKKFSVSEMCEIIKLFSLFDYYKKEECIDKLWVGVIDKGREINERNIAELYHLLPVFIRSRKTIFNVLERKMDDLWWRVPVDKVVEVLSALTESKLSSLRTLTMLTRNLSINIHLVSEDHLLQILTCFSAQDYIDNNIEIFLEKYVKAKGAKVKNTALMSAIMEYCAKFLFRNETILQYCADYLICNNANFSSSIFKSFFVPFGILNFQPLNSVEFWKVVERFLDDKFVRYRPDDVLDIILTCVYLEKFPLNTTKKVLNPYFLDRLHSYKTGYELQELRTRLKIYDTAMTLECPQYGGPVLPREYVAKSIVQDGRIRHMINLLYDIVSDIAGGCERISTSILLPHLPSAEIYLIDILLHPAGMGASMENFNFDRDHNLYMAILIHLDNHYCSKGLILTGPQAMKKRHLKKLGLSVVDLKYAKLIELKGTPLDMQQYLIDMIEDADKAYFSFD